MRIRFMTALFSTILLGITAAAAQTPAKKAPASTTPEYTITLATKPAPAVAGANELTVTVTGPDQKPVTGADVSVTFQMPPMGGMAEMKNFVSLKPVSTKPEDAGKYTGKGQIMMAGQWNATVSVKVDKKEIASKKLTVTAK